MPGHGTPGGEWSRQDRPPGLDHVARLATERPYREFRLDHTDGSKKLRSQRQCSFPVVAGEAAMRGPAVWLGSYLFGFWKYYIGTVDKRIGNRHNYRQLYGCMSSRLAVVRGLPG